MRQYEGAKIKVDLNGRHLSRCVVVGDAGMVSAKNLSTLARAGGRYIVCMPIHRGSEMGNKVLTRPRGRYQSVAENLKVREVTVGNGERHRRYVCYNPREAERQARNRKEVLDELAAEIESLREASGTFHSKRVCERTSVRCGRYERLTPNAHPRIAQAKIEALSKLNGKFVASARHRSNVATVTPMSWDTVDISAPSGGSGRANARFPPIGTTPGGSRLRTHCPYGTCSWHERESAMSPRKPTVDRYKDRAAAGRRLALSAAIYSITGSCKSS